MVAIATNRPKKKFNHSPKSTVYMLNSLVETSAMLAREAESIDGRTLPPDVTQRLAANLLLMQNIIGTAAEFFSEAARVDPGK